MGNRALCQHHWSCQYSLEQESWLLQRAELLSSMSFDEEGPRQTIGTQRKWRSPYCQSVAKWSSRSPNSLSSGVLLNTRWTAAGQRYSRSWMTLLRSIELSWEISWTSASLSLAEIKLSIEHRRNPVIYFLFINSRGMKKKVISNILPS